MDFSLSEEQLAFRDMVRRWVDAEAPKDWMRKLEADEDRAKYSNVPAFAPAGTTYEVVWRDSATMLWSHAQSAGSAMTLKLDISKDNVLFGVRAVDAAGHRSLAVPPVPAGR